MKFFVQAFFALAAGWMILAGAAGTAQADTVPACLDSATRGNPTEAQNWWDRRSAEEQKYMRELPCEERYIVAVCVFLYDPNLKECTNKGVARFRANRHCAAQGHEMLSEEAAACEQRYIENFSPVF